MPWLAVAKRAIPIAALIGLLIWGGKWISGIAEDRAELRAEVAALEKVNADLRTDLAACDRCETAAAECNDRLDEADALAVEWQARYDARPVRRVVVEVPADVIPAGTSCEESVALAAAWFAENPAPWEAFRNSTSDEGGKP